MAAFLLLPMTPGGSSGPDSRDALVAPAVLCISGENAQMQQPLTGMESAPKQAGILYANILTLAYRRIATGLRFPRLLKK